jgi:hypothetical protein
MTNTPRNTEADRAAQAFYGQSEAVFARQIEDLCRNDARLIAVFEQTRLHYLKDQRAHAPVIRPS